MDGKRFDAWTRRRFGLAAGGLVTSLVALVGPDVATTTAKDGNKKNNCKNLGQGCSNGGKKKKKRKCCKDKDLVCRDADTGGQRCCRDVGGSCSPMSPSDCCTGLCQTDQCFCKTTGQPCTLEKQCCSGNCDIGGTGNCLAA